MRTISRRCGRQDLWEKGQTQGRGRSAALTGSFAQHHLPPQLPLRKHPEQVSLRVQWEAVHPRDVDQVNGASLPSLLLDSSSRPDRC